MIGISSVGTASNTLPMQMSSRDVLFLSADIVWEDLKSLLTKRIPNKGNSCMPRRPGDDLIPGKERTSMLTVALCDIANKTGNTVVLVSFSRLAIRPLNLRI
jgi:hypothetical protein